MIYEFGFVEKKINDVEFFNILYEGILYGRKIRKKNKKMIIFPNEAVEILWGRRVDEEIYNELEKWVDNNYGIIKLLLTKKMNEIQLYRLLYEVVFEGLSKEGLERRLKVMNKRKKKRKRRIWW